MNMKNVVKRATCVIFALVLLLTSSVYAVNDLNELTFRGTISTDLENPELLNLDEIEIKIYQSTPIETEESFTLYSDSYAFSVYPDENGIFTFERPTPTFSLTIEVGSLPDGYGLDQHTRLYSSEITSDIFKLSAVDRAEIVADSLKYPGIKLFNADGEEVYATYDFNPTYRAFSQNDDVVEICGTVNLNGNIIYSVSSNVALPEIDAIDKVDLLYDLGAIDEVERIEKYIEIYEEGTSTSACATPIVDEILEFYASDEYQAAPMSVKTKIEDLFQTPEEVAYVFPKAVSNTFFTVHYDDSVTETVAQDTLKYLTSLRNTVLSLGFNEPINENGKTSLQVYITSLKNSNCNGETYHSEDSSKSSWSRIFIYNLNNLSPGDKETIAHEYFHAVQNTYYKYNGWFKEASGIEQIENISQCYNSSRDERSIPISFIEEEHVSTATELIGGSPLYGYTVGVCGTYEGSEAIGLCGHGLSKYSSIETPERTTIGYVSVAVFNNNGSGDYGIAKISNVSFTTAGLVGDPSDRPWEVTGASNRPVTGVDIVKYGKNSGLDYGYVTDNNATWIFYDDNNNKFTIRNVVQAKLQSGEVIKGDSGGPVFSPNGVIYGTISSTSNSSRSFYFSPFVYLFDRGFTVKKYG